MLFSYVAVQLKNTVRYPKQHPKFEILVQSVGGIGVSVQKGRLFSRNVNATAI